MMHLPLPHSMIAAVLLMGFGATATAAVVQCIDETGKVTFADRPCHADASTAGGDVVPDLRLPKAKASSAVNSYSAAEEARRVAWAKPRPPQRSLERDISTLKAARLTQASDDQARRLARQHVSIR